MGKSPDLCKAVTMSNFLKKREAEKQKEGMVKIDSEDIMKRLSAHPRSYPKQLEFGHWESPQMAHDAVKRLRMQADMRASTMRAASLIPAGNLPPPPGFSESFRGVYPPSPEPLKLPFSGSGDVVLPRPTLRGTQSLPPPSSPRSPHAVSPHFSRQQPVACSVHADESPASPDLRTNDTTPLRSHSGSPPPTAFQIRCKKHVPINERDHFNRLRALGAGETLYKYFKKHREAFTAVSRNLPIQLPQLRKRSPFLPTPSVSSDDGDIFSNRDITNGIRPEPFSYEILSKAPGSHIFLWIGEDFDYSIHHMVFDEFRGFPLYNPTYGLQKDESLDLHHTIAVIYGEEFFIDQTDIVVMIEGLKNITAFTGGTNTRDAYEGCSFATPMLSYDCDHFRGRGRCTSKETVSKKDFFGKKFKYLYNTLCLAWEKIHFDDKRHKVEFAGSSAFSNPEGFNRTSDVGVDLGASPPSVDTDTSSTRSADVITRGTPSVDRDTPGTDVSSERSQGVKRKAEGTEAVEQRRADRRAADEQFERRCENAVGDLIMDDEDESEDEETEVETEDVDADDPVAISMAYATTMRKGIRKQRKS